MAPMDRTHRPRRSTTVRAVIALGVAAACLLTFLVSIVAVTAAGRPPGIFDLVATLGLPIACGGVGALLTIRVPGNPIGPLLLGATVLFTILGGGAGLVTSTLAMSAATETPPPTALVPVIIATSFAFVVGLVLVLITIPAIFPTGRFLSPRWRWIVVGSVIALLLGAPKILFGPLEPEAEQLGLSNPLYLERGQSLFMTLDTLASMAALPLFALSVSSLVLRYRRGTDVERHQIRWLAAASLVAVVAFSLSFFAPSDVRGMFGAIGVFALILIPVAIAIAILRYRLYEIDRLISRSIAYALITAVLVGAYAVAVVILQGPLGGLVGDDTVVVAVSTLVVASLFQPVRRRIQGWVDHRFDRARVDAERTAGQFASRLRDEVDIEAVLADLSATVDDALRPARASLWLRDGQR